MSDTDVPATNDRFEAFRSDLKSMGLGDPNPGRDSLMGKVGAGLMVAGVVVGIYAYFGLAEPTTNPLQQRDAIVVALIGMSLCVVGSALFLRASFATFLRFWLARFSYEQHQIIDAIRDKDVSE